MVLLDNIIELFYLSYDDRNILVFNDLIERRSVGAALIHRYFYRHAVVSYGFLEDAHRCCFIMRSSQQKINCFAFFVDGTIEIFPDAFDLYLGLIHPQTAADLALMLVIFFPAKEEI